MTLRQLRLAILAAVNAFFDVAETGAAPLGAQGSREKAAASRRRAPVRPPAPPPSPPSDLDREAARQELRRMGVKVPR